MSFYIYTAIALIISISLLRAGCSNNGVNRFATTATLSISSLCWVAVIWYYTAPSNIPEALLGIMLCFEAALYISNKLVSWWQTLGYIK